MEQTPSSTQTTSGLKDIPLAMAYLAVPLGAALTRYMSPAPTVSPYLPWVILAALGTIHAILFRRSGTQLKKRFFFETTLFLGLIAVLLLRGESIFRQLETFGSIALELTPGIMLGFSGLWAVTFGLPDRAEFQRYGAILGILCILDLVAEFFGYQAVPAVRWIGDSNVLAGLLLVSLCAGLKTDEAEIGPSTPDQGSPMWRTLILVGLMACLSRTGLFAAGWILLSFGRGSRLVRLGVSLLCFLLISVTFLLPATPSDLAQYVDYWLWAKSLTLFMHDPMLLISGLPLDRALPFTFSPEMNTLWEMVTGSTALLGAHLHQVPAFWLRFLLGWGGILPLLFLIGLIFLLFRRLTRMGAGLIATVFVQGMSTPLLYDPTMGAVMGLALCLALFTPTPTRERTKREPAPQESGQITRPDTDPAAEWNLRPL